MTFSGMSSRRVGSRHSRQIPFKNLFTQDPGFNRDRGPVQVYSLRLRLSYYSPLRRSHLKKAIITCLAWLLLGCATGYAVRIRSISDPALPVGRNYVLLPGDKDVSSDRQFGELAGYVRRTLAELDYREVEVPDSADILVLLRYGLDPSSIDLNHLIRPTRSDGAIPIVPAVAHGPGTLPSPSYGLTYAPSYAEVAPRITPVSAVHRRWLSLEAVDAHASEKVTLWKIAAIGSGYYSDLKKLFPIMLAACKPFVGRDTKEVVVYVQEDDEEVRRIRGDSAR